MDMSEMKVISRKEMKAKKKPLKAGKKGAEDKKVKRWKHDSPLIIEVCFRTRPENKV